MRGDFIPPEHNTLRGTAVLTCEADQTKKNILFAFETGLQALPERRSDVCIKA